MRGTALGLLFEARCSHELLSEVHHEILGGMIVYPKPTLNNSLLRDLA